MYHILSYIEIVRKLILYSANVWWRKTDKFADNSPNFTLQILKNVSNDVNRNLNVGVVSMYHSLG